MNYMTSDDETIIDENITAIVSPLVRGTMKVFKESDTLK